jgi:hypothetical protein
MGRRRVAVATMAVFPVVVIGPDLLESRPRASVRHHPYP